jgi:hypothetical protein
VALAYVRACGGGPVAWEQRWQDIAAALRAGATNYERLDRLHAPNVAQLCDALA